MDSLALTTLGLFALGFTLGWIAQSDEQRIKAELELEQRQELEDEDSSLRQ